MLTKRSRLGESKLCPAEKVPLHTKQVADRGASSRTLRGAVRGLLLPRAEEQGTCLPSKRWVFPDTLRCLCMLMRSPVLEKTQPHAVLDVTSDTLLVSPHPAVLPSSEQGKAQQKCCTSGWSQRVARGCAPQSG